MEQFEQQLREICRVPNLLQKHCCIHTSYIRSRVIELLTNCTIGRYANVAFESDRFFERHRAIRSVLKQLEALRRKLDKKKYCALQKRVQEIIHTIDMLDI